MSVSTNEEVCCVSPCHIPNDRDKWEDTQDLPLGDFAPY